MSVEAERYSCQLKLPDFGGKAQRKLQRARVLIVGAGGLGCPAAQYLVAAGVGTVGIADHDTISLSNLHRQILFTDKDVGRPKALVAAKRLNQQNPEITVRALPVRLTVDNVMDIIAPYDVVADCTDNFDARYLLNDACVLAGKPLVYGAAYQYEGHVAVWNVPNGDGTRSPHYRDAFPAADAGLNADCSSGGVIPTLTGIIGCMEANEVIKYLIGLPGLLASRLLVFDAGTMSSRVFHLPAASEFTIHTLPKAVPVIACSALKVELGSGKYQLVDVRTAVEHEMFNIGGQLVPIEDIATNNPVLDLDFQKPIVLYCATGHRSSAAARRLITQHPGALIYSLDGGMAAWQDTATPAYG
jgi:adenylyltransferase/sulfurtransferase